MDGYLYLMIFAYLASLSLVSLLLMGVDKRQAQKHKRRIPERVLLGIALLGGSLGGLLGMYLFRHKTKHWYFRFGMPAMLLLQIALIAILIYYKRYGL